MEHKYSYNLVKEVIELKKKKNLTYQQIIEIIWKKYGILLNPSGLEKAIRKFKIKERLGNEVTSEQSQDDTKHWTEDFLNVVEKSVERLKPVKFKKIKLSKGEHKPEDFNLLFSDSQLGLEVKLEQVAGLSAYNFDIFKKYLNILLNSIIKIWDIHSKIRPIEKLNIAFLGDILEGENIYKGQPFYIDMTLMDQFFNGAMCIASFIRELSRIFPAIEIFCVCGNHGRPGRKGENYYLTNWDYAFYHVLSIILKDMRDRIKFYISRSTAMGVRIQNSDLFLMHGDEVFRWLGFPYYGIDRAVKNYQAATGKIWDITCMGHFHQKIVGDIATNEFIVNGSFSGGSLYSFREMKTISIPKQVLFGLHPRFGKTWMYDLKLADKTELKLDKNAPIYTPYEKGLGSRL